MFWEQGQKQKTRIGFAYLSQLCLENQSESNEYITPVSTCFVHTLLSYRFWVCRTSSFWYIFWFYIIRWVSLVASIVFNYWTSLQTPCLIIKILEQKENKFASIKFFASRNTNWTNEDRNLALRGNNLFWQIRTSNPILRGEGGEQTVVSKCT